jgi:hypothetical protein
MSLEGETRREQECGDRENREGDPADLVSNLAVVGVAFGDPLHPSLVPIHVGAGATRRIRNHA